MKTTRPIELPSLVSVRFPESNFRRITDLARTGHRTISQTVRLLVDAALQNQATEEKHHERN